jgi:hypothetical protein
MVNFLSVFAVRYFGNNFFVDKHMEVIYNHVSCSYKYHTGITRD